MSRLTNDEIIKMYYQGWDIKSLAIEYMDRENAGVQKQKRIGKVLAKRAVAQVIYNHMMKNGLE